ncbi:MAG TPA: HNH endonuclease [Patescibacteria group bacterium]|jgi:hypothetical protein|nr:HNH endonuclease [Patescibacteria group bacterium]
MTTIFTSKGQEIWVDDSDYPDLSLFTWRLDGHGYAVRNNYLGKINGKMESRHIHMARQILGLDTTNKCMVDHIDGNPSNNQRANLRVVTAAQNSMNRGKHKQGTSRYKGVTYHKQINKWQAYCNRKYLGIFDSEQEAHRVYEREAELAFGEFKRYENPELLGTIEEGKK